MERILMASLKSLFQSFMKRNPELRETTEGNECFSPLESVSEGAGTQVAQTVRHSMPAKASAPFTSVSEDFASLWRAAELNEFALCKGILKRVGNRPSLCVSTVYGRSGRSVLHMATDKGHFVICELLLDYANGIDLNQRDYYLRTPLHLACEKGFLSIVKLLVRSGAELDTRDQGENTPIHLASGSGFIEVVKWLLTRAPDILIRNAGGQTPKTMAKTKEIYDEFDSYFNKHQQAILGKNREGKLSTKVTPSDFEILSELGKGSFGTVYLVRKTTDKRLYAMKILNKEEILSKQLLRYALAERNILTYVKHPFIVSLCYAAQTPENLLLFLEYCPGGTLAQALARSRKFSEAVAKIYICELVLALEELHNNGVIYRDLKPSNVVLDASGHAKLIDFGLSKEGFRDSSFTNTFCGSPAYLAPEVIRKNKYNKTLDWYSLGLLLYEMLTGHPPFGYTERKKLLYQITHSKIHIPSSLSAETSDFLTQLLCKEPSKRLGAHGPQEVKSHPYFKGANWPQILRKELKPLVPFPPPLKSLISVPLGSAESPYILDWTYVFE